MINDVAKLTYCSNYPLLIIKFHLAIALLKDYNKKSRQNQFSHFPGKTGNYWTEGRI